MAFFTLLGIVGALTANGVGLFAAIGATLAGVGWGALITNALAQIATSALVGLILGNSAGKAPAFSVSGKLQVGETIPRQFPMGIGMTAGSLVYANAWGAAGKTPNAFFTQVIALSDLPVKGLLAVMVDGVYVTLDTTPHGSFGYPVLEYRVSGTDYLWVKFYDGTQVAADAFLTGTVASVARPYGATRVGTNVAYAICTSLVNNTLFSGFPAYRFLLDSIKLYDPSMDTSAGGSGIQRWATPSTWGGDGDYLPVVQAYNVLRGVSVGGDWLYGFQAMTAGRLPAAAWIAEIAKCRATVTGAGGPEPRYRAGGMLSVDAECGTALEQIMAACAGRIGETGGIYKPMAGYVGAAVMSFTDDDIVTTEDQRLVPFQGLSETLNSVAAQYPEPDEGFNLKPAPQIYRPDLETADGGRRLTASVQLANVPYAEQVQRLMKAALAEARRARRHTHTLPPSFWALEANDVVSWTSARHGYSAKKFRIDAIRDRADSHVTVDMTECDPTDYDFTTGTDFHPPVKRFAVSAAPAAQAVPGFAVTAYQTNPGAVQDAAVLLTWDATQIEDVDFVKWQGRLASGSVVVAAGQGAAVDGGDTAYALIPSTNYEFRAKLVAWRNTSWTAWTAVTTTAAAGAPAGSVPTTSLTGTLQAAQEPAHTGDVTNSAGSLALTIANDAVTNAKAANMATATVKGRVTAGTGDPEDLTVAQAKALIVEETYGRLGADYTLSSTTSNQKAFNWSTNGATTLATGVYEFACLIILDSMSPTSGNAMFRVDSGGSASLAAVSYGAVGYDGAASVDTPTAANFEASVSNASPASIMLAGTGTALDALVLGTFDVTAAGTIIPSIGLVTAASAVMKAGSFFRCRRIGPTGAATGGSWS